MNHFLIKILTLSIVAFGVFIGHATAQSQASQDAAALAGQISSSLVEIINQAEDPALQSDSVHSKSATVALLELKQLSEDIDILEKLLANGKSIDQTLPHYRSIAFRRKNVQFFAEGVEIKDSIREQAQTIGGLMDQLDRVYN